MLGNYILLEKLNVRERDCNDNPNNGGAKVHKLNKCGKCEPESTIEEKAANIAAFGNPCGKNCEKRKGFLHEDNFTNKTPTLGDNTTTDTDNFRNADWSRIEDTNCGTGKIPEGSHVNVLSTEATIRTIGGTDFKYYEVEYEDCGQGNNKNTGLDPNKPCSDCFKGNPIKGNMEIAPQKVSGINGGTFGKTRKASVNGKLVPKDHKGVDIKSEFGAPIYAMIDGFATKASFGRAGDVVAITGKDSEGNTVTVQTFHMKDAGRVTGSVKAGDIIGYQGDSGNLKESIKRGSTVSHVHVKVNRNGEVIDPIEFFKASLNKETGKLTNDEDCN